MRLLLIGFVLASIYCFSCGPRSQIYEGTKLPSIDLLLKDSVKFNTTALALGKPIVLFFFDPQCEYCHAETEDILANIGQLKEFQLCLVTLSPLTQLREYAYHYKLYQYKNIIVTQDQKRQLFSFFNVVNIPTVAIFNRKRRLQKVIVGNATVPMIQNIALN